MRPLPSTGRRRSAVPLMLGWSLGAGLLAGGAAVAGTRVLDADVRSAAAGAAFSLGVATLGLLAIVPATRAGLLSMPAALGILAVQALALLVLERGLRDRSWIHPQPLALAALVTLLGFQTGAVVGYLRARTPVLELPQAGAR